MAANMNLSYIDMNVSKDGSVLTREQIRRERERRGYCTECQGAPTRLFIIKKSKYNPLWTTKEPCNKLNCSLDGTCLLCHPEADPSYHRRRLTLKKNKSVRSSFITPGAGPDQPVMTADVTPVTYSDPNIDSPVVNPPAQSSPSAGHSRTLYGVNPHTTSPRSPNRNSASLLPQNAPHSGPSHPDNASPTVNEQQRFVPSSFPARVRTDVNSSDAHASWRNASSSIPSMPLLSTPDFSDTAVEVASRQAAVEFQVPPVDFDESESSCDEMEDTSAQSSGHINEVDDEDNMEIMFDRLRRSSIRRSVRTQSARHGLGQSHPVGMNLAGLPRSTDVSNSSQEINNGQRKRNAFIDDDDDVMVGRRSVTRSIATNTSNTRPGPARSTTTRSIFSCPSLYVPPPPPPPPVTDSSPDSHRSSRASPVVSNPNHTNHDTTSSIERNFVMEEPPICRTAPSPAVNNFEDTSPFDDTLCVNELQMLINSVSGANNPDTCTDILVESMKSYPDSVNVQLFCLGTIWNLCNEREEYMTSIISTSAPDDILMSMKRHLEHAELQERACGALWSLSVNHPNRIILIRAGSVARVIKSMVEHIQVESVIRSAFGCLRTLSTEPEVRQSMGPLSGVRHVCDAMAVHRSIVSIQRDGCAFLSNCAVDLEIKSVALAADFELEAIVNAMSEHVNNSTVTAGACFALKNYTYEERNARALYAVENILTLLEQVSTNAADEDCRRDAAIVLDRLQISKLEDEGLEDRLVTSLTDTLDVTSLLETMTNFDWSAKVTAAVFQRLFQLIEPRVEYHHTLRSDQILQDILARMGKFKKKAVVIINGCALLQLLADHESVRSSLLQSGACTTIVNGMREHMSNHLVQIAATGVLMVLSSDFECWFELQQCEGNPVADALAAHPQNPTIQQNSSIITTNFATHQGVG